VPQDIDPISQLPDDAQLLKQQLRASANEVQRLKLMVDKLKLQLARRVRAQFGSSSALRPAGQLHRASRVGAVARAQADHAGRQCRQRRPQPARSSAS
jgi:hypothetical protein